MTRSSRTLQQRGKPLVAKVLESTLFELAHVGYEHLSIEDIAARAGVNKTTIYRRWTTLDALVLSAIESAGHPDGLPDTGSLQGDLISYLQAFREVCRSPVLLSLAKMQFTGGFAGKLGTMVRERMDRTQCDAFLLFKRAKERGEIPPAADIELIRDIFLGAAHSLVLFHFPEPTEEQIKEIVSVILFGAVRGS